MLKYNVLHFNLLAIKLYVSLTLIPMLDTLAPMVATANQDTRNTPMYHRIGNMISLSVIVVRFTCTKVNNVWNSKGKYRVTSR